MILYVSLAPFILQNGVTAMCMLSDGTLVTGDAKGSLYAWDILRKCVSAKVSLHIRLNIPELCGRITK